MLGVMAQTISRLFKRLDAVVVGIIHAAVDASERPSKVFTEFIRIPLDPLGQIIIHVASVVAHCLHKTLGLYIGHRLRAWLRTGRNSHGLRARFLTGHRRRNGYSHRRRARARSRTRHGLRTRSRTRRNRNVLRNSDSLHSGLHWLHDNWLRTTRILSKRH